MDRLAELRERRALTLRELSEMSGVAADTINQIELGHRKARPSTLRKLAKALDVEVRELFEEPATAGKAEAPEEKGLTEAELMKMLLNPATTPSQAHTDAKRFLQHNRVWIVISALEELIDHAELVLKKNMFDLQEIESLEEVVAGQYFNHRRFARSEVLERGSQHQKTILEQEEARMDKVRDALREAYRNRLKQAEKEANADPGELHQLVDRSRVHEDRIRKFNEVA